MRNKTVVIGLMLFALFFGAGNLIYPPILGMEAGTSYWIAIAGFITTGVGLPILAVVAISLTKNKSAELGMRVHPMFSIVFSSVIYLAIGPFFGSPRAANVGYEMGVEPFLGGSGLTQSLILLIFTLAFYGLVFWLSLSPLKLVDRIGQWLTPALVIAIAALSIGAFFTLDTTIQEPAAKYQASPFFTGFVEGYLTMDAIAALAFGIIVVTAFSEQGVQANKKIVTSTIKAGLVAGIGLTVVYSSIGWIGAKMTANQTFENGGAILSAAAEQSFGPLGTAILGIIVLLACLTTSIGLTVACGQFFSNKFQLPYVTVVTAITLASLLVANLGLNQIIAISVPVLVAIYPIAIVLILLTFLNASTPISRGAILLTAFISLFDGLKEFGITIDLVQSLLENLPFFSIGMGWVVPAIIGGIIGGVIQFLTQKSTVNVHS
ncbi:branched-chain amino acid transport system II carrier protein [Aquibacillus sediminis]|uniref:branched-chain amino acid transport system II carrier protein n=1 Tax=Aquibacillus sediminis TaxID=2574734 RepID=UPI001108C878|nr:branched-chain amino acid transport system II carrier protein [Aquibacillus sediminis]